MVTLRPGIGNSRASNSIRTPRIEGEVAIMVTSRPEIGNSHATNSIERPEHEKEVAKMVTLRPEIGNSCATNSIARPGIDNSCATNSIISNNGCSTLDELRSNEGGTRSGNIATLDTTDMLDCHFCSKTYSIPVYQCDNGHTASLSCCENLKNKCYACGLMIGYIRCHVLEKVLEAAKITCLNSKYGCKEKVSYTMIHEHERSCAYGPCYCPLPDCCFDGSHKDLCVHFAHEQPASATRFMFDSPFTVDIGVDTKYKFLQEHDDHILFILNIYDVETIGNVANIIRIGPSSLQKKYPYEL